MEVRHTKKWHREKGRPGRAWEKKSESQALGLGSFQKEPARVAFHEDMPSKLSTPIRSSAAARFRFTANLSPDNRSSELANLRLSLRVRRVDVSIEPQRDYEN